MDPAVARAALAQLVVDHTGIDATAVFWARRPRTWAQTQYAILRLTGFVQRGQDAVTFTDPGGGADLIPHQRGLRDLVWQCQFWSHDATDTLDAFSLATALRDRLRLPETKAAMKAADLGFADVAALLDIDRDQDDREMSVAQLDVRLNAFSDVTGAAVGYVDTWGITGTLDLSDGGSDTIISGSFPS